MSKFYTNENFPLPAVQALRAFGYDALTSLEAGKANQSISDEDVFAFSRQPERILLTVNRKHFIKLHITNPDHPGIIAGAFDPDFAGMAKRVSEATQQNEPIAGKLVRINRPG
jgi:hypothetical protein